MVHIYGDKDLFRPYAEKFRVFTDRTAAYKHAMAEGFTDGGFGMGFNDKVGVLNSYACGDVKVDVIHLQTDLPTIA